MAENTLLWTPPATDAVETAPAAVSAQAWTPPVEDDLLGQLRSASVDELYADKTFRPDITLATIGADKLSPEDIDKLTEIYTRQHNDGFDWARVPAALKQVPGAVADFVRGGWDVAKRLHSARFDSDLSPKGAAKREKEGAELTAAVEAGTTETVGLAKSGFRKVSDFVASHTVPGAPQVSPEDFKNRLFEAAANYDQQQKTYRAEGEVAKATGFDAKTLAEHGITVDEAAINRMSDWGDLTNFVPMGAGWGVVSKSGKPLFSAATREAAEAFSKALGEKLKSAGVKIADAGKQVGALRSGQLGAAVAAVTDAAGVGTGALVGAGIPTAARAVGGIVEAAGDKILKGPGPILRTVGAGIKGGAAGVAASLPMAAASEYEEDAAAITGVGGLLGAGAGAAHRGAQLAHGAAEDLAHKAVAHAWKAAEAAEAAAPVQDHASYGTNPQYDAAHTEALETLKGVDPATANVANRLRAVLEGVAGSEGYLMLADTFDKTFPTAAGQNGFYDGASNQMFWRVDSANVEALRHEPGHMLWSVMPPKIRDGAVKAITGGYRPEEIAQFKKEYEDAFNKNSPTPRTFSDDTILEEIAAEHFSAILRADKLDGMAPGALKEFSRIAAGVLESIGLYKPTTGATPNGSTVTALGVGISPHVANKLADFFQGKAQSPEVAASLAKITGEAPVAPAPVEPTPAPVAPVEPTPAPAPAPAPVEVQQPVAQTGMANPSNWTPPATDPVVTPAENLRVTPEQQATLDIDERPDLNIAEAAEHVADASEQTKGVFKQLRQSLRVAQGQVTPVEITYNSVTVENDPTQRAGRRQDQAAQKSRTAVKKLIVATGFTPDGKQLTAMSPDKVLSNAERVTTEAEKKGVANLVPYKLEKGKLPQQFTKDLEAYLSNQAAGYKGNGKPLTRPENFDGFIPPQNPSFKPTLLSDHVANFLNLVMGIAPPKTNRVKKLNGVAIKPTNVRARELATANLKPAQKPGVIGDPAKQNFPDFGNVEIAEFNPLRKALDDAGVNTRSRIEVTERLNLDQIESVTPRPTSNFRAPVTDLISAGFMPSTDLGYDPKHGYNAAYNPDGDKAKSWLTPDGTFYPLKPHSTHEAFAAQAYRESDSPIHESWKQGNVRVTYGDDTLFAHSGAGKSPNRNQLSALKDLAIERGFETLVWDGEGAKQSHRKHEVLWSRSDEGAAFMPDTAREGRVNSADEVRAMSAEDFATATRTWKGGLTGQAIELGKRLSHDELPVLESYRDEAHQKVGELRGAKDFEGAMLEASRGQFFREAVEALRASQGEEGLSIRPEDVVPRAFMPDSRTSGRKPNETAREVASEYMESIGGKYVPDTRYVPVNVDFAKRVADFYEAAKSAPEDRAVKTSYQALADETMAQYDAVKKAGVEIEPWTGKGQPYANSAEMVADVSENKHIWFFRTENGYGETDARDASNPMLANSGIEINGTPLLVNDVFRAIHDYFGHVKEGNQFGPRGEFNAWRNHSEMFSDKAQGALAAETLAQNSWVNYGPQMRDENGNVRSNIPLAERSFAEQKQVVVPQELIDEAKAPKADLAFAPRRGQSVSIEDFKDEQNIATALTKPGWTVLTATQEALGKGTDEVNVKANDTLAAELAEAGYDHVPVNGSYKGVDQGLNFLITGISPDEALELGKKYKQESVLTNEGLVYADGTRNPVDRAATFIGDLAKEQDFYSQIEDGPAFSLGIDFSVREPLDKGDLRFMPALTEAGKELERRNGGFKIEHGSNVGLREVKIRKKGVKDPIGETNAFRENDGTTASVGYSTVEKKFRGQRLSEVPYRELGAQLQKDGAKTLKGNLIAPQPLSVRRKVFGEPTVTIEGEKVSVDDAIKALNLVQEKIGHGYAPNSFPLVEARNEITPDLRFAPKAKKQALKPKTWILPDGEVAYASVLHENYLAENSEELNKRFGTKFATKPDQSERNAALKRGFVRLAFNVNDGTLNVEASEARWTKTTHDAVQALVADNLGKIYNMRVSLLNSDLKVTKQDFARLFQFDTKAEKLEHLPLLAPTEARSTRATDSLFEKALLQEAGGLRFMPQSERIKAAASRLNDGEVFTGLHHAEAMDKALRGGVREGVASLEDLHSRTPKEQDELTEGFEQGFVTDTGRFISRADAAELAEENGQLKPGRTPSFPLDQDKREQVDAHDIRFAPNTPKERTKVAAEKYPEALPIRYRRDENGHVKYADGFPVPMQYDYDLFNTPLAKQAMKGLKGDAREVAAAEALGNRIADFYDGIKDNPEVMAGKTWYSDARTAIKTLVGDDADFFAQLLAATSARTPVEDNFKQAVDAYNLHKAGAYDAQVEKYKEGMRLNAEGKLQKRAAKALKVEEVTPERAERWWIEENDLMPMKSNGKKFNANSFQVLRVLAGTWKDAVGGPKTPNFAGNLSGSTLEATIDVWAARLLRRAGFEGMEAGKPWRILPENETGVTDPDFFLGQKAFRHAAEKLGMNPDDLQAIMWFAEKDLWEKRGWTQAAGAAKSDFNSFLGITQKNLFGGIQIDKPQKEFGLDYVDLRKRERGTSNLKNVEIKPAKKSRQMNQDTLQLGL